LIGIGGLEGCSQWNLYGEPVCQGFFLADFITWQAKALSLRKSIPRGACSARAIALAYLYAVGRETRTMMQ